ncbi:hypothetical protein [Gemmatimonas sp.]|uniref:hypothetical protein n=1 Tax=Gemmatimonas sp. TaxID=1962908 RepID=UPI0035699817
MLDVANGALVTELCDAPPSGPAQGSTPSNVALPADEARLFVTEADANAVAIFDLSAKSAGTEADVPAGANSFAIGRTDRHPRASA